jgi:hypothetical protein
VRAAASSPFAHERGEIEADVMGERFEDARAGMGCTSALNPFACYGTSTTTAAQTGALVSWRVGREWLLIADTHVGYQRVGSHFVTAMTPGDPTSPLVDMPVAWPRVISVTGFVRVQWRYR